MTLNHLGLVVRDIAESRDWYTSNLGLSLEFEVPERRFAALEDDSGFGLLLSQGDVTPDPVSPIIYFEVRDVDELCRDLMAKGVRFDYPPRQTEWGYGPQLRDPDGYIVRFFDHRSVTEPAH